MGQLLFKKLRYTFQVLKQFYLFPEPSSSSVMSLDKYDKLVFNDESIHTLVKKLETKMMERKIWAFLNIKMMKILKKASQMSQKLKRIVNKKEVEYVSYGFERIKFITILIVQKIKNRQDSCSQTTKKSE